MLKQFCSGARCFLEKQLPLPRLRFITKRPRVHDSLYLSTMQRMYNYEPEKYVCPLCQIIRGEPTDRGNQTEDLVFKNELATAFVSGKWWRTNPGHVIIIPNTHIENLYDMPEDIGHTLFDISKKIALALKDVYQCDGVSTRQHNGPAGNQNVWHYHQHIFPRYEGDNLYLNHADTWWPTPEEKRPYVEKIKQYFQR